MSEQIWVERMRTIAQCAARRMRKKRTDTASKLGMGGTYSRVGAVVVSARVLRGELTL